MLIAFAIWLPHLPASFRNTPLRVIVLGANGLYWLISLLAFSVSSLTSFVFLRWQVRGLLGYLPYLPATWIRDRRPQRLVWFLLIPATIVVLGAVV